MRVIKILAVVLALLTVIYFLGPHPETPVYNTDLPALPDSGDALVKAIAAKESKHILKPENGAEIIWVNDSTKAITEYAIVYIPGFTASHKEGDSVHRTVAKYFGCNLYLARNEEHGIDTTDQLIQLTADKYWEGAKYALSVGCKIGKKVLLMSTSTGGTLSLKLAATYPDKVAGLIMYSPNIEINNPNAWLLNNHWGLQIARIVTGGKSITPPDTTALYKRYWNAPYRLEGAVAVQELVETTMKTSTFEKVNQPALLLYYYKDEAHQDPVVKVSAMQKMFAALATPADKKVEKAMPLTENHVIASPIKSKDVEGVLKETILFCEKILLLKPAQNQLVEK